MPASADMAARARAYAHAQFAAWANDPLSLVLDVETTGLTGDVWEVAAVRVWDRAPVYVVRGQVGTEWSERALEMHGADIAERLEGLPHLRGHVEGITGLLGRNRVLTWGAEFDRAQLVQTLGRDLAPFECVMSAYAPLAGNWSESKQIWKWVSLAEAARLEDLAVNADDQAHTALGDARLTAQLIQAVAQRLPESYPQETEWEREARQADDMRGIDVPDEWTETIEVMRLDGAKTAEEWEAEARARAERKLN
jgi:DNA polymerase III subunit epsilon